MTVKVRTKTNLSIHSDMFRDMEVGGMLFGVIQWEWKEDDKDMLAGVVMASIGAMEKGVLIVHIRLCYTEKRMLLGLLKGEGVRILPNPPINEVWRPPFILDAEEYGIGADPNKTSVVIKRSDSEVTLPVTYLRATQTIKLNRTKERIRYKTEFWFRCKCGRRTKKTYFHEDKGFVCHKCGEIVKDHPECSGELFWYEGECIESGLRYYDF